MLLSAKAAAGRQQRSEPAYVAVAEASYVKKEGGHVIEAPTETKARGLAALEVLRKALEEATGANVNKPTTAALTTLARLAVQIDQQREEATLATERANRAERASIRASTILEQASASSAAGGGGDGGRLAESVRILEASVAAAPAEYMSSDFKVALARIQVLEMRLQEVETAAMEEARGASVALRDCLFASARPLTLSALCTRLPRNSQRIHARD